MRRLISALGIILIPQFALAQTPVTTSITSTGRSAAQSVTNAGPAYHPGRTLVRFRSGAQHSFLGGSPSARNFPGSNDLYIVENPPGMAVAEAVRRYRADRNVEYAEPDFVVRAVVDPTDPSWAGQWDMVKIAAPAAWDLQQDASDVVLAIIDTGVDYTHPDLIANLWTAGTGEHGYTCIGGSCVAGGLDDFGHGTHVAGTIGASANNGVGIAGINWHIQMMSLKFLDSNGSGYISDAVLAFKKVTALKTAGINIRVTSNSWGGGGYSQALKDAMADAEAAGVVHICAAGNSGVLADVNPMYPAAYDNRGIVSVLATDSGDLGASFTNYGLASVDIAAPGVSTLSTVPTGSCTLCDPSGYKLLSGTSMATPHVSGVVAAMLHRTGTLTPNQVRDVLLDPASYDVMTDPKAKSTSSGGRLNFYKAITNPLNGSITTLNNFPVLTMGPDGFAASGGTINLTATASDADAGDTLRMAWGKSVSTGTQWLFGWNLNSIFPNPAGSTATFTAPTTGRDVTVPYDASVADNRGGGDHGRSYATVWKAASPWAPPTGALSVSATDVAVGTTVNVNFAATDGGGGTPPWDLFIGQQYGTSGWCCFTGGSVGVTFNSAGVYRVSTTAMDRQLNASTRPSLVVRVGGAVGTPPIASATLDKLSGVAPLTVNVDMSASSDPDGTIQWYFIGCGNDTATPGTTTPSGSCTYTTPGVYWLMLQVQDNSGLVDLVSAYVVVTPNPGGPDVTPPTVSVTSPANGAAITAGTIVPVTADASDASGIAKVDFYDVTASTTTLIGTATTAPYMVNWNTTGLTGAHTLRAVATDGSAGANTNLASIGVTVNPPPPPPTPPAVAITSPAAGNISKKAKVTITALVTPKTNPVNRVDFKVNNTVVCSVAISPAITAATSYGCAWQVPAAAGKSYDITATAFDTTGLSKASAVVTVIAK